MTLEPPATPGTTVVAPVDGSGGAPPPGTTEPAAPADGSVSAEEVAALRTQLEDEQRKNRQLLSEKSNTEERRRELENNQRRNARLEQDLALVENPPVDADPVQVAAATARIAIAAADEANQRAMRAERRAEQAEQRITTTVPDHHRAAIDAAWDQGRRDGRFRTYAEAAAHVELEARRAGTWEQPKPEPGGPRPPAASPAPARVGTVTRGVVPTAPALPASLPESQYVALKRDDPAKFEQLRKLRLAKKFAVTPG